MTKPNTIYFHILSDHKTLKEVTWKEYCHLMTDERKQIGWINIEGFFITKGFIDKPILLLLIKMAGWIPA